MEMDEYASIRNEMKMYASIILPGTKKEKVLWLKERNRN